MSVKSSDARTSAMDFDGAANLIVSSGSLDLVTAVTAQGHFLVPWNCKVVGAWIKGNTATDADAIVEVGSVADPDAYLDGFTFTAAMGTTMRDIISEATWVGKTIPAGTVLVFAANGGATAAGNVTVTLVLSPNA